MPQMSMIWPWSSQACAISDTETCHGHRACISPLALISILLALLLFSPLLFSPASAGHISSGQDIQAAIDSAQEGEIISVGAGSYSSIIIDRPLSLIGEGRPVLNAALQKPAVTVKSNGVTLEGFEICGVEKDPASKFEYYMKNREAARGQRLDVPNAAVMVEGSDFLLLNSSIYRAQAGVYALDADGITIKDCILDGCDTGLFLHGGRGLNVSGCSIINCRKFGLDIECSGDTAVKNCSIINNSNVGILFREGEGATVDDNLISGCTFGLSLWNASHNQVRRNRVDHNYYGILVTNWSCYNNITDNLLIDNSRGEITAGFGIGLSLQENSSYNLVVGNVARGNYNGLEISKGCQYNAAYANNASGNKHGIRMNENRNNLIFGNSFLNNNINAYENLSRNVWNTTIGNCYSDYQGEDENGDGIGEQPYSIPGPQSRSIDHMPLLRPFGKDEERMGAAELQELVRGYATLPDEEEAEPAAQLEKGIMVISSPRPRLPPRWGDFEPLDVSRSPFQEENYF